MSYGSILSATVALCITLSNAFNVCAVVFCYPDHKHHKTQNSQVVKPESKCFGSLCLPFGNILKSFFLY